MVINGYQWLYDMHITIDNHFFYTDHCETLRRRELNYGKLTRAKENTGEPPVLRRQVQRFSIRSVHLLHRPCEDDSSVSKFLSAKQILNEFAKYCEE